MAELIERIDTVEIPKGTGLDGFFKALGLILRRPRVQKIEIEPQGKITYRFFAREEDPQHVDVDFDQIMPYAIMRNSTVVELPDPSPNAAVAVAQLFAAAAEDRLFPVGLATGTASQVWAWFERTVGIKLRHQEELYGLPVFPDRHIPDDTLSLLAAYGRSTSLLDTRHVYKIVIPPLPPRPEVPA